MDGDLLFYFRVSGRAHIPNFFILINIIDIDHCFRAHIQYTQEKIHDWRGRTHKLRIHALFRQKKCSWHSCSDERENARDRERESERKRRMVKKGGERGERKRKRGRHKERTRSKKKTIDCSGCHRRYRRINQINQISSSPDFSPLVSHTATSVTRTYTQSAIILMK